MKASVLKSYIREQILSDLSTPSVDEASEEEVENQKDLNKELEKTAQLKSQISEKDDSMDFPKELLSRNRDIIFRLVKVGSDRAKYELINKETGEPHELGFRFFQSVGELERDANNIIIPSGGTQSSQFESTLNEEEDEDDKKAVAAAKASKGKFKKLDLAVKALKDITTEMKSLAKKYSAADETEKEKIKDTLKSKTSKKKELESLVDKLEKDVV
jgi:hypothetical protein|tara:strand:+ start:1260 stop:1907 length:648 start_codon:yes stop_codon:yes gene_type:complete